MTERDYLPGPEPHRWTRVYRRGGAGPVHVVIPRVLLEEAGVPSDVELLVRRRSMRNRRTIILEFKRAEDVPEEDRI